MSKACRASAIACRNVRLELQLLPAWKLTPMTSKPSSAARPSSSPTASSLAPNFGLSLKVDSESSTAMRSTSLECYSKESNTQTTGYTQHGSKRICSVSFTWPCQCNERFWAAHPHSRKSLYSLRERRHIWCVPVVWPCVRKWFCQVSHPGIGPAEAHPVTPIQSDKVRREQLFSIYRVVYKWINTLKKK